MPDTRVHSRPAAGSEPKPGTLNSSLPSHMASQGLLQLKTGRKGNARPESNKHCFQVALRCHFTCEFNVVTECQENEVMFLRTEFT